MLTNRAPLHQGIHDIYATHKQLYFMRRPHLRTRASCKNTTSATGLAISQCRDPHKAIQLHPPSPISLADCAWHANTHTHTYTHTLTHTHLYTHTHTYTHIPYACTICFNPAPHHCFCSRNAHRRKHTTWTKTQATPHKHLQSSPSCRHHQSTSHATLTQQLAHPAPRLHPHDLHSHAPWQTAQPSPPHSAPHAPNLASSKSSTHCPQSPALQPQQPQPRPLQVCPDAHL